MKPTCPTCHEPVDPKSAHIVVYPEAEAGTYHHGCTTRPGSKPTLRDAAIAHVADLHRMEAEGAITLGDTWPTAQALIDAVEAT